MRGKEPGAGHAPLPLYVLDGARCTSLEAFYDEIERVLIPNADWGRNLDAFNDILRGGFGTPPGGFVLRWEDSALARASLGHSETVRQLEARLAGCHPSNRPQVRRELERARAGLGPTVFDWLLEILAVHGPGGREEGDRVEVVLA